MLRTLTGEHSLNGSGGAFTGGCQGFGQVLGGGHDFEDPFLKDTELGRLRQRVRDGQFDGVVPWKPRDGDIFRDQIHNRFS